MVTHKCAEFLTEEKKHATACGPPASSYDNWHDNWYDYALAWLYLVRTTSYLFSYQLYLYKSMSYFFNIDVPRTKSFLGALSTCADWAHTVKLTVKAPESAAEIEKNMVLNWS